MDKNDFIMSLLDWNQSKENQNKGIQAAREIENLDAFIQPCSKRYNKNVWENCAVILAERTDEELTPHLSKMLEWLVDLNWPGACQIFNRLVQYEKFDIFIHLRTSIKTAIQENETQWLVTLLELQYRLSATKQFAADYLSGLFVTKFRDYELSGETEVGLPLIAGPLEQISPAFLRGAESMLRRALQGSGIGGCAIIAEKWLRVYLDATGEVDSVRGFLAKRGYSSAEIDRFYEQYRRDCLFCYGVEPQTPSYANGALRVYRVDGAFVAVILDIRENGTISPKGAEFTQDRQMKWAEGLELPRTLRPGDFLGKTTENLREELGPVPVFLTLGKNENVPCYLTRQGRLVGFILFKNRVVGTEIVDLLAAESSP